MNLGFDPYFEEEDINPIVLNGLNTKTKSHDFFSMKGNGYKKRQLSRSKMMTFILKMKKSRYNICSFRLEGSNEEDAVPMGKMDEMILVAPRDDVFKKKA